MARFFFVKQGNPKCNVGDRNKKRRVSCVGVCVDSLKNMAGSITESEYSK